LGELLAEPENLKKVLLGHVVAGNYPVAEIRSGDLPTLNGGIIKIVVTNDGKPNKIVHPLNMIQTL